MHNLETIAATSDALAVRHAEFDEDLHAVIDAWLNLCQADRDKIIADVEAADQ